MPDNGRKQPFGNYSVPARKRNVSPRLVLLIYTKFLIYTANETLAALRRACLFRRIRFTDKQGKHNKTNLVPHVLPHRSVRFFMFSNKKNINRLLHQQHFTNIDKFSGYNFVEIYSGCMFSGLKTDMMHARIQMFIQ